MRIVHEAVPAYGCTFEVWDGDIDEAEVRAHLLRLAEDVHWPPGLLNLVDLTTMGKVSIPDPDLVALLREGTVLERELRTALVVRGEFIADTGSQFDEAASATGVTTFATLSAASLHLGISPAISLPIIERLRQAL